MLSLVCPAKDAIPCVFLQWQKELVPPKSVCSWSVQESKLIYFLQIRVCTVKTVGPTGFIFGTDQINLIDSLPIFIGS